MITLKTQYLAWIILILLVVTTIALVPKAYAASQNDPVRLAAALSTNEPEATLNLPFWSIIPFAGLLLTIGVMSFIAANFPHSPLGHLWESNRNKLIIALLWALPVVILLFTLGEWTPLQHSLEEYFSFIALLFALFVISGGIYLEGDLKATPAVNLAFLGIGSVLANFIGTTGASVLLIRPLLKTNSERQHTIHIPVFFIFIVSNIGGCLLPIGDPPLFLGYLRGVPFFWTLNLVFEWLVAICLVLAIFFVWDTLSYKKETAYALKLDTMTYQPLKLKGGVNFVWLAGVLLAVIFITPNNLASWGLESGPLKFLREYLMLLMAGVSLLTSPLSAETRRKNNFTFAPILEVAYLFIGIFVAMIPALEILKANGAGIGVTQTWQFFWATGGLSSVLDNAPTYLTFLSLAQGLTAAAPAAYPVPANLAHLGVPAELLAAISLGAVFMGANTYIGNGPNFMVKAIADEWGYKMPDFFTYIFKYSLPILLPVFIIITFIFFR
ncbi:MAG: sodium:proton antiporter [Anaerolineae bacterium]|nr:sodium:proton antiporter [Anaerolineae bacterium]